MYEKENKVYFYGFDRLHQLQGNPWNLKGDWITVSNIRETAKSLLRQMNITEVIVVDSSYEIGREYKELTLLKNYKNATEHILFYEFLKTKEHFSFSFKLS